MLKPKKLLLLSYFFLLSLYPFLFAADETLTITTYYPSPYGSYSQLTADQIAIGSAYRNPTYADGTLYVKNVIGIGTTNTTSNFEIASAAPVITYYDITDANDFRIDIYATLGGAKTLIFKLGSDGGPGNFTFKSYVGKNWLFDGGNVGIGTTSPQAKLHIDNGTADTTLAIGNNVSYKNTIMLVGARLVQDATTFDFHIDGVWSNDWHDMMHFDNGTGNVGIGMSSPTQGRLVVQGTAVTPLVLGRSSGGDEMMGIGFDHAAFGQAAVYYFYKVQGTSNLSYVFSPDGGTTSNMVIQANGNVGIGTTGPSYKLQLSTDSAAKPGTNTWTIASDSRLKKDIRPYTNGLSIIKRINPVWFKYNGKGGLPQDNQEHIGVIGQEIVKVAPYTVNTFKAKLNPEDKESTELLNFNSHALTFDLINAVKELSSELENLKTRLSRLEARK